MATALVLHLVAIVLLGSALTSAPAAALRIHLHLEDGRGHWDAYRDLCFALAGRGHAVSVFLPERALSWVDDAKSERRAACAAIHGSESLTAAQKWAALAHTIGAGSHDDTAPDAALAACNATLDRVFAVSLGPTDHHNFSSELERVSLDGFEELSSLLLLFHVLTSMHDAWLGAAIAHYGPPASASSAVSSSDAAPGVLPLPDLLLSDASKFVGHDIMSMYGLQDRTVRLAPASSSAIFDRPLWLPSLSGARFESSGTWDRLGRLVSSALGSAVMAYLWHLHEAVRTHHALRAGIDPLPPLSWEILSWAAPPPVLVQVPWGWEPPHSSFPAVVERIGPSRDWPLIDAVRGVDPWGLAAGCRRQDNNKNSNNNSANSNNGDSDAGGDGSSSRSSGGCAQLLRWLDGDNGATCATATSTLTDGGLDGGAASPPTSTSIERDARPVVFVSLGTSVVAHPSLLRAIVRGLGLTATSAPISSDASDAAAAGDATTVNATDTADANVYARRSGSAADTTDVYATARRNSTGTAPASTRDRNSRRFRILWTLPNTAVLPLLDTHSLLAEDVMFTPFVPQDAVLTHPHIALFLTHGGLNSVLQSLDAGVPMLCAGIAYDQLENCQAVQEHGAGVRVTFNSGEDAAAAAIADALARLLSPSAPFASVAAYWGRVARTAGGLHRALEVVERTAELGSAFLEDPTARSSSSSDGGSYGSGDARMHRSKLKLKGPRQPRLTFLQRTSADAIALLLLVGVLVCYSAVRCAGLALHGCSPVVACTYCSVAYVCGTAGAIVAHRTSGRKNTPFPVTKLQQQQQQQRMILTMMTEQQQQQQRDTTHVPAGEGANGQRSEPRVRRRVR